MKLTVVLILLSVGLAVSREINTDTTKDGKHTMEGRIEALERGFNSQIESVELAYNSGLEDVKKEVIQLKEANTKIRNSLRKPTIRQDNATQQCSPDKHYECQSTRSSRGLC